MSKKTESRRKKYILFDAPIPGHQTLYVINVNLHVHYYRLEGCMCRACKWSGTEGEIRGHWGDMDQTRPASIDGHWARLHQTCSTP